MCDLNEFDVNLARHHDDYLSILSQYANAGLAYTGISQGKVYAMFGVYEYWKGSAEVGLFLAKIYGEKRYHFTAPLCNFLNSFLLKCR